MITLLHTIDTTGPGGAETVFIDLATLLPRDQYRSIVLIRGKGWVYDELCRRGVRPILMDAKGSFNWRYLRSLTGLIRRERVDLIQSHLLGSNVYCSLAGLLTGIPVISTFHGEVDIGRDERFMALKFAAINAGSRHIVAVSEGLKMRIAGRTPLRVNKTGVIYNGIDTRQFSRPPAKELRQQLGWPEDCCLAGCLGNIRPAKDYPLLLEAAALLKGQGEDYRFVIAGQGEGELFDRLLSRRKELGLEERVVFLGFNDDPAGFLANLDLFVLPSSSEGFSIATIQAMASGLPVVVTRSGGPEEIVSHAVTGWMVDVGDAPGLANGLRTLGKDPDLRQQLASAGRQHAMANFDIQGMLSDYQQLYQESVSAAK